jgi:hypothetical protein
MEPHKKGAPPSAPFTKTLEQSAVSIVPGRNAALALGATKNAARERGWPVKLLLIKYHWLAFIAALFGEAFWSFEAKRSRLADHIENRRNR